MKKILCLKYDLIFFIYSLMYNVIDIHLTFFLFFFFFSATGSHFLGPFVALMKLSAAELSQNE